MNARLHRCPNCGATLAPRRFARDARCEYCGAVVALDEASVSAAPFREARRRADLGVDDPRPHVRLRGDGWFLGPLVARGEASDVHYVERARPPLERGLLKLLRDPSDLPLLVGEWRALDLLRRSDAPGADALLPLTPSPVAHGVVEGGAHAGRHASILRHAPRFEHTLEDARAAYPGGVDPRIAVWVWRRILELLAFVHASGLVHGAVLPQHVLVQRGEHGARLVGFGCADVAGARLRAIVVRHQALYPADQLAAAVLDPAYDLAQSARTVAYLLGSDDGASFDRAVPGRLQDLLRAVGAGGAREGAWSLRERLGALAAQSFGPPSFHPLVLPTTGSTR